MRSFSRKVTYGVPVPRRRARDVHILACALSAAAIEQRRSAMSTYTVKNIKDVEDVFADAPSAEVEGRFMRKHLDSHQLGVSYFRYGPNYRSKMGHSHLEQEEAYVVTSGSGRVRLDDEIVELGQWDVVRVAPNVIRAFEAGSDGLELIAIGGTRPEEGDGVAVPDWWID
jgi:mannose-6-phosphate isomerase-like protein (cupin superfamily)